jgi:hypothetical protein
MKIAFSKDSNVISGNGRENTRSAGNDNISAAFGERKRIIYPEITDFRK